MLIITSFILVVCPPPPAIANASVSVQDNVAKYYCLSGFFAKENTNDVITCSANVWPATDFECIGKYDDSEDNQFLFYQSYLTWVDI
jgi:hypothetical protein